MLRWFVGLPLSQPVLHLTSFTKSLQRLLTSEIAEAFFAAIRGQAEAHKLLSRAYFSVDAILIEAASGDGGRNPDVDFHGEQRGNETHRSITDPEARLPRKGRGKAAKLCYTGHALIENRNGLVVTAELTQESGTAEREAGLRLLARERSRRRRRRMSVAADKGYDAKGFFAGAHALGVTSHVARTKRPSAIDGRTTRHAGYAVSLRRRKRIEEGYGWMKVGASLRKLRHRGRAKVSAIFIVTCTAYKMVSMRRLLAELSSP